MVIKRLRLRATIIRLSAAFTLLLIIGLMIVGLLARIPMLVY
jgi:hypothetical protein